MELYKINNVYFYKGKQLADYLEIAFTEEEILNNQIQKEWRVGKKRFGVGARITKVLSAIADNFNLSGLKERYIGNMTPSKDCNSVNVSIHPLTGYLAGLMAKSCLAPTGCNRHAGPNTIGYKNVLLFHNDDLTWRAWGTFDFEAKIVAINKGYPQENYDLQYAIRVYFKELGYKINTHAFAYPLYWDTSAPFNNDELEDPYYKNHDSYYPYSTDESLTGYHAETDSFIPSFYSSYNDNWDFDPDHEVNDEVYCEYEDAYYSDDEVMYSETLDSYVSSYGEDLFWRRHKDYLQENFVEGILSYFKENEEFTVTEETIEILNDISENERAILSYILYDDDWTLKKELEEHYSFAGNTRRILQSYFWDRVSEYRFY